MTTIKSYTDISQSKTLSKILPLESADMYYIHNHYEFEDYDTTPAIFEEDDHFTAYPKDLRCWSLAALLDVLPNYQLQTQDDGIGILCSCNGEFNIVTTNNPIDACYEMILKLHKQNLL